MNPVSVATIPFLAFAPDWTQKVNWKRTWIGDVATAIFGAENRSAMRARGLVTLSYRVESEAAEDREIKERLVRAALQAGRVALPYWSHAADLSSSAAAGSQLLTLNSSLYTFRIGDFIWIRNGDNDGQINRVTGVAGSVLSLALPTAVALDASDLIWPVVFGVLKPVGDSPQDSPARLLLNIVVTDIDEAFAVNGFYLAAPSLLAPVSSSFATSYGAQIAWSPVSNATSYFVEIFEGSVCGGAAIYTREVAA